MTELPLIMFTNDDGIDSPGLHAAAAAFDGVGELLVVAPRYQQTGMGRSLPSTSTGHIDERILQINGGSYKVYAVDGTPAQAVLHGVMEVAPRLPALIVSGINYGENTGSGVTISGTVGAAMEAAAIGIPAIAISQQMGKEFHHSHSNAIDFSAAAHFALQFGKWLLSAERPPDVDFLKIEIPADATPETAWRIVRQSKQRLYRQMVIERLSPEDKGGLDYEVRDDLHTAEPDSDIYALWQEKLVAVTPMSLDMTSRVDLDALARRINIG